MQLHSFFNSSTSYRVRIALAIKGISYDTLPVNIRVLEHRKPEYVEHNPSASVPLLTDDAFELSQSLAIIDYLDARYPEPRLIPLQTEQRARVLELSNVIGCDMHPVNNMRILKYLKNELKLSDAQKQAWYHHWIAEGMTTVEAMLRRHEAQPYCFGETPTLADCCLVPHVANALRMGCALSAYSRAMAVYQHCMEQPAFGAAAPERQPDYIT